MDSVRNATFRIAFRRHMSLCAPFAASRWTDIWRLLLSQNGNTHFGSSKSSLQNTTRGFPYIRKWYNSLRAGKSLDRHMAASSILKWQYSLQVGKLLSRYNAASFYLKMAIVTSGVASRV